MNLLIENLNSALLNKIDANVIKTLHGEFTKEDLANELSNLYFSKVIIDITAIKDYENFSSLFDFLNYFDKDRIIILLDENTSKECVSKLVQEGYYDFTKNVGGINYLTEHPNTLKDVEKYIIANQFQNPLNEQISEPLYINSKKEDNTFAQNNKQFVIGIQNLTPHAGSTTLTYLFTKRLSNFYNVEGIEMRKQDHIYFRDLSITECTSKEELKQIIRARRDKEVIVVDLNDIAGNDICNEVLYLIEPGIISLSKLFTTNNYKELINSGKVVLNRSSINNEDLPSFEYETGIKVFYNLKNIDERLSSNAEIDELLFKLGLNKVKSSRGFFGIFQ